MNVSEENLFSYVHVAMTLGESILVGFGESGDIRILVDLVHLLEDKVVCSIVLADNGYSTTLVVEAHIDLTSR